ncbi:mannitol dehydrogenase family protein [Rhodoferax sp. GW822-FHT02A01]|uniref:mannitol dehydrogenase family protein n=1 Tax=Rhodoferax sp. GW822-FHT02A01 TaxID=3141537 RepID=UPI00315D41E7
MLSQQMAAAHPILQFGTGRFLQAHVDLFVAEALRQGQALGHVTVVQSTASPQSSARAAALSLGYRVEVRGMQGGRPVETTVEVDSVQTVWHADRDWSQLLEAMATSVQVIVSNTADAGYVLNDADNAELLQARNVTPRSFPAKLLALLYHRWRTLPAAPLTILPCELVSRNGDTLRNIVVSVARQWGTEPTFVHYLQAQCVWVNSLVDRIVSSPLEPAGAVTEPYALWAIELQPGLVLPCQHPAMVLTDDLPQFEQRKLWLLNLAHTFLADRWLSLSRPADETVLQAMHDPLMRDPLESVWADEVLPVFDAEGGGLQARSYLVELRDRLLNPFLEHRLADIAKNHEEKLQRRILPVVERAVHLGLGISQPLLRQSLGLPTSNR